MRDLIWTIITIWVVWRLIEAFRSISATRNTQRSTMNSPGDESTHSHHNGNSVPKKGELKPDAGEYVDYEEVK